MTADLDNLPADAEALRALLIAERTQHAAERDRLRAIIVALQRHRFGRRSEQLDPDQLALGLEDLAQSVAAAEAQEEHAAAPGQGRPARQRKVNRGALPEYLPRVDVVIDVEDRCCPCCAGALHRIGEDVAERLDVIPLQFRVLVVRRPKYACRTCPGTVVQAPAPPRLIEGGLPTEALIAHVIVAKYADHSPLYRQAQIYARQGIALDRSTLADWSGRAAWWLRPLHVKILSELRASPKLFADETTAPVLDPGRGRTKTGQLWAYARDDRPWGGPAPPAVAYVYAPDRKAERPIAHLEGFRGILQVDGYAGYRALAERGHVHWHSAGLTSAAASTRSPPPVLRRSRRRPLRVSPSSTPLRPRCAVDPLTSVASSDLNAPSRSSMISKSGSRPSSPWSLRRARIAEAIRYALSRWDGLCRFIEDGHIEIDSNIVERAIRPLALNRKNALFAGSDGGGEHWAILASLIESCKLNNVDPESYLSDVLARLVADHPANRLGDLLPWNWAKASQAQRAA